MADGLHVDTDLVGAACLELEALFCAKEANKMPDRIRVNNNFSIMIKY